MLKTMVSLGLSVVLILVLLFMLSCGGKPVHTLYDENKVYTCFCGDRDVQICSFPRQRNFRYKGWTCYSPDPYSPGYSPGGNVEVGCLNPRPIREVLDALSR